MCAGDVQDATVGEVSAPRRDAWVIGCNGPLDEGGTGEVGEERGGDEGVGGRRHASGRDAGDVRVHKRCSGWIECEAASVTRVVAGTARQWLEKFAHGGVSGWGEGG